MRNISTPVTILEDLGDDAGADGAATFAHGKAQALFHRDRRDQRDGHLHVITRHHHLRARGQVTGTGHIRGAEVELL
ncbi:hypothetical protein SPICUR_08360 [Spiribacter curvatus]|uniref:Uncharacterized protein n=1 Tax=Spiribacter curvatus TaxID=1335757 RepID=U5T5B4_9GAMM|nr:hypothetical protein SPICUR_08360 [Spiribacter curvatus]